MFRQSSPTVRPVTRSIISMVKLLCGSSLKGTGGAELTLWYGYGATYVVVLVLGEPVGGPLGGLLAALLYLVFGSALVVRQRISFTDDRIVQWLLGFSSAWLVFALIEQAVCRAPNCQGVSAVTWIGWAALTLVLAGMAGVVSWELERVFRRR